MKSFVLSLFSLWFCGLAQAQGGPVAFVPADSPHLNLLGRYAVLPAGRVRFAYPGSGIGLRFEGSSLSLVVASDSDQSALTIVIDRTEPLTRLLHRGEQTVVLANDLVAAPHTVEIFKRTETWQGILTVKGLEIPLPGILLPAPVLQARRLMFLGDSVTCGAGIENNRTCTADPDHPANDAYHSYGMLLSRRLDSQVQLVCYGGRGLTRDHRGLGKADNVLNAPEFLDLSVPAEVTGDRAAWPTTRFTPDGIVVSLGTNDFNLQKTKPLSEAGFVTAYVSLLHTLRAEYPHARIFATEGAIVTDPLLRQYIQAAVRQAADPQTIWIPSVHYPGNGCDGHPTRAQHLRMTDDFEPLLRQGLGW